MQMFIIQILSNPIKATNTAHKAYKKIRDVYDIEKIAAKMKAIYIDVIR